MAGVGPCGLGGRAAAERCVRIRWRRGPLGGRDSDAIIAGYGRWLTWLNATGVLDPLVPPSARMTRPRLRAFTAVLEAEVAPFTVASSVERVGNAMRALAPEVDWHWIRHAASRLRAEAVPVRGKRSRLRSPEELVACGVALMTRG